MPADAHEIGFEPVTAEHYALLDAWLRAPHMRQWWGEPEGGVAGIGSGGNYALAAAKALLDTDTDAEAIARKALAIAAEICVYTNDKLTVEIIDAG